MRSFVLVLVVGLLAACATDPDPSSLVPSSLVPSSPVSLPASFPAEVPMPVGVELAGAETHVGEVSTIHEITGWFDGDPVRAARDYLAALEVLGFDITGRTESPDNLYFVAQSDEWYLSAGFYPDPVRNVGSSVGITVAPAG
ncbi:MAG: hypothetical protein ACO4AY_11085 [Ilumatobacteraceae bacterium]